MEVIKLNECGYDEAKYGFSLSFKDRNIIPEGWRTVSRMNHYDSVLKANAPRNGGHNKFLRQIILWIDIEMPRSWWPEMDQYKIATVSQSESTVHTLLRRPLDLSDCEEGTRQEVVDAYNSGYPYDSVDNAKKNLPEGYLQRRVVTCNYETIRNIISQRKGHKVQAWSYFIDKIVKQLEHPEFVKDLL